MDTFATYNKKLDGYKDVSETVKIIEKIAASQLHDLGKSSDALAEYTEHILCILVRIRHLLRFSIPDFDHKTTTQKTLLLIITGDKGLVGDLWNRLFSSYKEYIDQDILVLGKKGIQQWPEKKFGVEHYLFSKRIPDMNELHTLSKLLNKYIDSGKYNLISTLHLHSNSIIEQNPVLANLLPVDEEKINNSTVDTASSENPIIEGELLFLQKKLYKKYILSRLQQIILETAISEFSARTVAMEHASTKTDEISDRLAMVYSRERRHRETQKQLERFSTQHISI